MVKCLSDCNGETCNHRRLITVCCFLDNSGEAAELLQKSEGCFIGQEADIHICLAVIALHLAKDAGAACIGVLNIRTCLTVEVEKVFPTEGYVLDPLVVKVVEDHGSDTDMTRNRILVLQLRVLLLDDGADLGDRLQKNILGIDDISVTGGELFATQADKAVGNMNQSVLRPLISEELHNLEYLLEMQSLFLAGDIETFIKMIVFLTIEDGCQISGCVDRASVVLQDETGCHVIGFQIYDLCAFALGQKACCGKAADHILGFIAVEAFTHVVVELHTQKTIGSLELFETDLHEPLPDLQGLFISALHFRKPEACFILQCGILVGFLMEEDIQTHQFLDALLLYGFFGAPFLISHDQLSELCTPVAQVVDPLYMIAELAVDLVQGVADNGSTKMSYVEVLRNVR